MYEEEETDSDVSQGVFSAGKVILVSFVIIKALL